MINGTFFQIMHFQPVDLNLTRLEC